MAETGGIQKSDIISESAIKAPLEAAENIDAASESYDRLIRKTKDLVKANDQEADSIVAINKLLVELTRKEQDLVNLQNKHNVQVNKLIETQKKQQKEIDALNKKLKEKQKLEEESADAIEALDNQTGGYIGTLRTLGKELSAIAKNPITIALGVLAGAFYAVKESADVYYKASGEGEDMLAEKIAASTAAIDVLRNKWASAGKAAAESGGQMSFWGEMVTRLVAHFGAVNVAGEMRAAGDRAIENTKKADKLADEMIEFILEKERNALTVAQLTYEVSQKHSLSLSDQLFKREQISSIRENEMKDEIAFAQRELSILQETLAIRHNMSYEQFVGLSNEEQMATLSEDELHERTKLYEANAKIVRLQKEFYLEERKNVTAIDAIKFEAVEKARKSAADKKKASEQELKDDRAAAKERGQLTEDLAKQEMDFQDEAFKKYKEHQKEEIAEDEARLEEREKFWEEWDAMGNETFDNLIDRAQEFLAVTMMFVNAFSNLFSSLADRREQRLDDEQRKVEEYYDERLKKVEDNEEETKKLEEEREGRMKEFERQKRAEARRTAIYEKAIALTQAGINVALAITKVLWNPVQVALTSVLGAIQLAAIAAKPIPGFFRGVEGFGGGLAYVGEKGPELILSPGRSAFLSPGRSTLMNLLPDTSVIPAPQTSRILNGQTPGGGWDDSRLIAAFNNSKGPDIVRRFQDIYEVKRYADKSAHYTRKQIFPSLR